MRNSNKSGTNELEYLGRVIHLGLTLFGISAWATGFLADDYKRLQHLGFSIHSWRPSEARGIAVQGRLSQPRASRRATPAASTRPRREKRDLDAREKRQSQGDKGKRRQPKARNEGHAPVLGRGGAGTMT